MPAAWLRRLQGTLPLGVDLFFICCPLDERLLGVLPFEGVTVMTLKIYNGEDFKFQRYEDPWVLLEK